MKQLTTRSVENPEQPGHILWKETVLLILCIFLIGTLISIREVKSVITEKK